MTLREQSPQCFVGFVRVVGHGIEHQQIGCIFRLVVIDDHLNALFVHASLPPLHGLTLTIVFHSTDSAKFHSAIAALSRIRQYIFSYVRIFVRMHLRLLPYPFGKQLFNEFREVLPCARIFQKTAGCFLCVFP